LCSGRIVTIDPIVIVDVEPATNACAVVASK
jgi:hypothetical protein